MLCIKKVCEGVCSSGGYESMTDALAAALYQLVYAKGKSKYVSES